MEQIKEPCATWSSAKDACAVLHSHGSKWAGPAVLRSRITMVLRPAPVSVSVSAHVCSAEKLRVLGRDSWPTSSSLLVSLSPADHTSRWKPRHASQHILQILCLSELKGQNYDVAGPKLAFQDAVILQQKLTPRVSYCFHQPLWDLQRRGRQLRPAAFSGAAPPTYFCWQPLNPALAWVSHWPSPMPKIKQQKGGGERNQSYWHDISAFTYGNGNQ